MPPLATVGILSIGEMGMGIAKLLIAHNYRVVTNIEGRSEDTHARVLKAAIEPLPTDTSLVTASDYILSIVPPRHALTTAQRITTAISSLTSPKPNPLYYLDLNAISPRTARSIAAVFNSKTPDAVKFVDGGIIGSAPSLKGAVPGKETGINVTKAPESTHAWNRPSIPVSGPNPLSEAPISGSHIQELLNIKHISGDIGPASGLKCCFATTTKGFTALCIQAFSTAHQMGVLEHLKEEMGTRIPTLLKTAEGGVPGMPPKAYRWVKEMEEIGMAHSEEGGFEGQGKGIFDAVAEVYRTVAEDTVLGEEKTERRKRGRTVEDVAAAMGEGLDKRRRKME